MRGTVRPGRSSSIHYSIPEGEGDMIVPRTGRQLAWSPSMSDGLSCLGGVEGRMALRQTDTIEVKRIKGKGRGVFARRAIRKGEVIETVPMLVLPAKEFEEGLSKTV